MVPRVEIAPAQQQMSPLVEGRDDASHGGASSVGVPHTVQEVCEELDSLPAVRVLQMRRTIGGCKDLGNHYAVLNLRGGRELMYFRETFPMGLTTMCCLPGHCKGFHMEASYVAEPFFEFTDVPFPPQKLVVMDRREEELDPAFMRIVRPYTCPVCCFCRPRAEMKDLTTGKVLGVIEDPWSLCQVSTRVTPGDQDNPHGRETLVFDGGRFQKGGCCPVVGSKLQYRILQNGGVGASAATLNKAYNIGDFCPTGPESLSAFDVLFEPQQSPERKLLMIVTSMFVHQQRFDSRGQIRYESSEEMLGVGPTALPSMPHDLASGNLELATRRESSVQGPPRAVEEVVAK